MANTPNSQKKALLSAVVAGALTLGFAGMMARSCGAPVKERAEAANPALELVDSLASRLVLGLQTDATIQYSTAGGATVIVSQSAPRRAYRGAGVTYISTPDGTYLCRAVTPSPSPPAKARKSPQPVVRCDEGPGVDAMSPTQARAISEAFGGEFMAPEAAMGRLATIARGEDVRTGTSKRGDAQCVSVTALGIRTETACVNPAGLLAYFDGTTDAGRYTQLTLQYTTPSVSDEAFLPPDAAPKASPKASSTPKASARPARTPSPKASPGGTEK
ncbi:hypothetical protein Daura_43195 [Dactylosporangium aurantiacum]|uniref:Uncharacterized protein n=1 Tax=Dactylosporangium aurantiacum TaxID=35754 RepID=A0A9Q9IC31_9ACTN|nr:hypothetical protein [Dactylosporangium aurantiacum]MDG6102414.1 hypothetical protein [Dactylosporangium aurantiacum]UWZ53297.1 hypothetical protein Daura_43195 [Dactylosporangium aurantiacum]